MAVSVGTVAIWFVWAALVYFVGLSGYSVVFMARHMSRRKRFAAFDRRHESEDPLDDNDAVDAPDYRQSSPEKIRENQNPELASIKSEVKGRTEAPKLSAYLLILSMVWLISAFGLPISMLNSIGALPDWSIDIANMDMRGSHASLVFFLLFTLASGEMFRLIRRMGRFERKYEWHEKFARVSLRSVVAALPISVVLVWLVP